MEAFEIIMAIFSAIMQGYSVYNQQQTNQQNVDLARENREDQQAFATEAAQTANQVTEQQYNKLYSPSAKVQQLRDAGLSPGLMYSNGGYQGSGVLAAQAASPSSSAPIVNPLMMPDFLNMMTQLTQAQKTKAETKKTEAEEQETRQNIAESNARIEEIKSKIKSSEYQNKLTEMQTELAKQTAAYTELQTKFENETYTERARQYKIQNDKTEKEIDKMIEEINGMQIDNSYKAELNQAIIDNYKAQKLQYLQQVEVLKMEKAQKEIQNKILQAQSEVEKKRLQKTLDQMDETIKLTKEYIKTEQQKQKTEKQKRTNMSTSNAMMQMRMDNYQIELFLGRAEKLAGAAGVIF